MLGSQNRLRNNNDLLYVLKKGMRHYSSGVLLYWTHNREDSVRIGCIVGKKFSRYAVKRNRQKRLLRSAMRDIVQDIVPGTDIVISYANHGKILPYAQARDVLRTALEKNNLIIK